MPWTTAVPVIVWTLINLVLGVLFWRRRPASLLLRFVLWLDYLALNLVAYFIINWSIVNYYLRFVCLIAPAVILVRFLLDLRGHPWLPARGARAALAALVIAAILLPVFSFANVRVMASMRYKIGEPVPLLVLVPVYGMWVVTNGGNAIDGVGMSNYANALFPPDNPADPSMAYAVDMQEITIRGQLSPEGSRPADYRAYEGFNTEIYAPCQGTVVFVETGNPEKKVGAAAEGLGDRVVIQCFEVYVTVAGLRNVLVSEGEQVRVGSTIGYLGNTGAPTMPHLHVHATVGSYGPDGTPVPLLFEYIFPTRNRVFIR